MFVYAYYACPYNLFLDNASQKTSLEKNCHCYDVVENNVVRMLNMLVPINNVSFIRNHKRFAHLTSFKKEYVTHKFVTLALSQKIILWMTTTF